MSIPRFRTGPFYNGLGSFKTAFPSLYDAAVEWEELSGPEEQPRNRNLRRMGHKQGNFSRGLIPCGNDGCHEGGYPVDRVIAEMLELGETERSGVLYCGGREIPDEGRRGPIRCRRRIAYKITLTRKRAGSSAA